MEQKEFKITINAPREKVWESLWDDATYPEWTAAFHPGSRAESDWQKGSKALFVDSKKSGMVAVVEENIPNEFMSFKILGNIKDGVEDYDSDEAKAWSGGLENYTLTTVDGGTELTIALVNSNIPQEFIDYFMKTWPIALQKLKEISERN